MSRTDLALILAIPGAALLDCVVGPVLLCQWTGLHFTAAAVALLGARKGAVRGALGGWFAGLVLGAFSAAPFGLYLLSFGVAGFLAGLLRPLFSLGVPWVSFILLALVVAFEDTLAALAAWAVTGVAWQPAFLGVAVTLAALLAFGWRAPQSWAAQ